MDAMPLTPEQIIQNCQDHKEYRVLWVSEDQKEGYWISLSDPGNIPMPFSCQEVTEGLRSGSFALSPEKHVMNSGRPPTKAAKEHRDKAWNLIKDAVANEPEIYDKKLRSGILKEIEKATGVSRTNLYGFLGKYWKGGMTPDALLPNYAKCGRASPLENPSVKRCGRKKVEGAEGKVLTPTDTQNFFSALKKYYYTTNKLSLEKTYQKLQQEFYAVRDENGIFISLLSPDEIPSRDQFLYWHRKNKDLLKETESRDGARNYPLKSRSSIDRTETFLSGPCAAAQIDATIADIFLVSQNDRTAIVGRPTLYFLIDCYSRMVLGMHITLESPSTQTALMCILNALEDKSEYCARFGISIDPSEWPCRHKPSVIIADRGEAEGQSFDEIIRKLGISIENMPPFRGDLKGIIEQYFHLINISLSDIPGSMGKDYGERCTKDYRLDAVLDIQEFTQIIIHCVLLYNNYHYMEYYSKTSQMRQLSVLPVPRDIWNYGLRYCNGAQTIVDVDSCRYLIFPKDTGSITEHGIQFNGRYYGCARGFAEKWFDCARIGGHTKVTVAYDPNDVRHLYIQADPGSSPEECHLLDGNKISSPFTVAEAEQMARADHEERVKHRPKEDTETARTSESIEKIVNAAKQKQPQSEKSKAQRIKEIKENRKAEINAQKPEPSTPVKNAAAKASAATVLQKDEMDPIQSILFEELNIVLGGENE